MSFVSAFLANITTEREINNVKFPSKEDLDGAATALLRLQDTYNLDTNQIAEGKISGTARAKPLTAHDCFELGRISYNQADYYHTLMWMQEALDRLHREAQEPTIKEAEILEYLAFSMYQQGNVKRALQLTKRLAYLGTISRRLGCRCTHYVLRRNTTVCHFARLVAQQCLT
jgi:prolyl 4-hydroxylase